MTILPQVAIFLLSLQLVSMQFFQSTNSYLENKDSEISNQLDRSKNRLVEFELIGGGNVITSTTIRDNSSLFAKLTNIKSQTFSVLVDESSIS
jgi:hypothetical protein